MKKRGSMLVFIAIIVLVIALFVFLMMPRIAKTLASGKYALKVAAARDIALTLDTIYSYPYDIRLDYDVDLRGLQVKIFDKLVTVQENGLDPTLAKYPFVPVNGDNPDFLLNNPRKIYFYKADGRVRVSAIEEEPRSACNELAFGLRIPRTDTVAADKLKTFVPTSAVAIAWGSIQPTNGGSYDFSIYDTEIDYLVDNNIEPRVAFCDGDCFPSWTKTSDLEGYCCVGDDRKTAVCGKVKQDDATKQAFTAVVRAMVGRYKDRIQYWGFGIEPNCRGESPATYTMWLKLFTDAVRAEQPNAVIIGGHLSGTDSDYLSHMYDSGAKDYFDAIALDPYGEPLDYTGMQTVRELMIRKGDSSKKIWVTEWGISSGAEGDDRQAALIDEGLRYLSTTPWIGAAYYHNFECELYNPTCRHGDIGYLGFGILRGDATEKPSFSIFKQLAENCRPQSLPSPDLGIPVPYNTIFTRASLEGTSISLIAAIFKCGEHAGYSCPGASCRTGNPQEEFSLPWPNSNGPWASSPAGAQGPFQFIPSTWAAYSRDCNNDGVGDVQNLEDSACGASAYLRACATSIHDSLRPTEWNQAWCYNHDSSYADKVYNCFVYLESQITGMSCPMADPVITCGSLNSGHATCEHCGRGYGTPLPSWCTQFPRTVTGIDVAGPGGSDTYSVQLPRIDGQPVTWRFDRIEGGASGLGFGKTFSATMGPDTYSIYLTHLSNDGTFSSGNEGTTAQSGTAAGSLFPGIDGPGMGHVHIQVMKNGAAINNPETELGLCS